MTALPSAFQFLREPLNHGCRSLFSQYLETYKRPFSCLQVFPFFLVHNKVSVIYDEVTLFYFLKSVKTGNQEAGLFLLLLKKKVKSSFI